MELETREYTVQAGRIIKAALSGRLLLPRGRTASIRGSQIAHVSSVKVPVPSPSSIPIIWEVFQVLTGPSRYSIYKISLLSIYSFFILIIISSNIFCAQFLFPNNKCIFFSCISLRGSFSPFKNFMVRLFASSKLEHL